MRCWVWVATALLATDAGAQTVSLSGLAGQSATVSGADIAAMPHQPVTLKLDNRTEACEGTPLGLLLERVGAPEGKALHGPELADAVIVSAADGYRIVLALAETDPMVRSERVMLVDRCGGAPLPPAEGPFRLVVEGDLRPARSARQVNAIAVRRVGP
jgi:hypothetical protein